eukprot:11175169-Lingulodinium_polyedra.AAC.1
MATASPERTTLGAFENTNSSPPSGAVGFTSAARALSKMPLPANYPRTSGADKWRGQMAGADKWLMAGLGAGQAAPD